MGKIHLPLPAKLIVGVIACRDGLIDAARQELIRQFGAIDAESERIPFTFTSYYQTEMGENLIRCWLSFARLQPRERLAELKLLTNRLEEQFLNAARGRQVNLDPGLLSEHNFALATTKDYAHRLYLGQGIFAEVTLIYEHGQFQPLRWTYPDYRSPVACRFLDQARGRYRQQLAELRPQSTVSAADADSP